MSTRSGYPSKSGSSSPPIVKLLVKITFADWLSAIVLSSISTWSFAGTRIPGPAGTAFTAVPARE